MRLEVCGPRGKSTFAKQLGLSPSTYDYYEADRIPPAPILVRIADLAGVDLRWLLTGDSPAKPLPANNPIILRVAQLLADKPDAAAPLAAFLDLLEQTMQFPAKGDLPAIEETAATENASDAELAASPALHPQAAQADAAGHYDTRQAWIPILGRSAAGVPCFWTDESESRGLTVLGELIWHNADDSYTTRQAAVVDPPLPAERAVQIITLGEPDAAGRVEFVQAPAIKARYPDAFAVWIDGQSMTPDILHGDLVVLSPSAPATNGRAAVIQLRNQIGVTCKLYRRDGDQVHLIALNPSIPITTVPADTVQWALRVLARIRR